MTESQRHAVAAGFIHILRTHHEVYERFIAIPKTDAHAVGALIQAEMGLAKAPDPDDLRAMASYIDSHLKEQTDAIREASSNAPHHVGFLIATQQS